MSRPFPLVNNLLETWPAYPATQKTGKYKVFKPKRIGEKSVNINNILSFQAMGFYQETFWELPKK